MLKKIILFNYVFRHFFSRDFFRRNFFSRDFFFEISYTLTLLAKPDKLSLYIINAHLRHRRTQSRSHMLLCSILCGRVLPANTYRNLSYCDLNCINKLPTTIQALVYRPSVHCINIQCLWLEHLYEMNYMQANKSFTQTVLCVLYIIR